MKARHELQARRDDTLEFFVGHTAIVGANEVRFKRFRPHWAER
ncbi:MAG: hypothetical protein AAFV29_05360 [Myxococcota bacterium]